MIDFYHEKKSSYLSTSPKQQKSTLAPLDVNMVPYNKNQLEERQRYLESMEIDIAKLQNLEEFATASLIKKEKELFKDAVKSSTLAVQIV